MPDGLCAVQCRNMRGKCDENNQQTTEECKKWITTTKRENWAKSENQVDNARLCM